IGILSGSQSFDSLPSFRQHIPGVIDAAVVNNNDFMGNIVKAEFDVKVLDCRRDASGFIARGNYDTQKLKWLRWGREIGHGGRERCPKDIRSEDQNAEKKGMKGKRDKVLH